MNVTVDCQRGGHTAKFQVGNHASRANRGAGEAAANERFAFRGKRELPTVIPVVQRLYAEPVARQVQALGSAIVDAEGEHAPQTVHDVFTPRAIAVKDHFGVAGGAEDKTLDLELRSQLRRVVDLAVVGDHDGPIQ